MAGFSKRALAKGLTTVYLDRFIRETCIAEVGHSLTGILGFTSLLFCLLLPGKWSNIWIFLIFSVLNFFIQMLFVIIQRYNRPKLERMREYLASKAVESV